MRHAVRFTIAGIMALLILMIGLAATSPGFHSWIHKDANRPGHECAVTQFQRQQLLVSNVAISLVVVAASLVLAPLIAKVILLPEVRFQLPPGRAPPFASSSLKVVG